MEHLFLKKSISSNFNQTYKNWEIIFFDNCSNDKSILIAKSLVIKELKYLNQINL